jgi:hypothetical protein
VRCNERQCNNKRGVSAINNRGSTVKRAGYYEGCLVERVMVTATTVPLGLELMAAEVCITVPSAASSYRPVVLTPCPCKIMGKMINSWITWFLESQNLLSPLDGVDSERRGGTMDNIIDSSQ